MTYGAKWVLAIFMALSACFAALGIGLRERSAIANPSPTFDPLVISYYLNALRGELPFWLARDPAMASKLLAVASSQMGRGYLPGGTTPAGFDCSGFTSWAYGKAGQSLPRTSGEQFLAGRPVAAESLRPGDLVFFGRGGKVGHVGIYLSQGRFIHSSQNSGQVGVDDLSGSYWSRTFAGGRRVLEQEGRAQ
ncbi:MAG: C40 family peptidase [Desulfovibrio sp.]|nr:C40 family peptidase [Desulfovibrio sp.]MBI4959102.1 C40 family peptidase [Desulfovibrio sp.]